MFYFDEKPLGEIMRGIIALVANSTSFSKRKSKTTEIHHRDIRYEDIDKVLKLIEETHVVTCERSGKPYTSSNLKIKNGTCWQHVPSL